MTTSEQLRAYAGPAWLSRGFRPFFLAAAVLAAIALPVWMLIFTGVIDAPGPLNGRDWHVHELLFGYLPAAMAGFILTAVPNWTGRLPVAGAPLLALFLLWLAGRVATLLPVTLAVAAPVDALFLFALAAVVGREIAAGRNYRNLPVAALITFVGLANAQKTLGDAAAAERTFLDAIDARPGDWSPWSQLGAFYRECGRLDDALR